MSSNLQIREEGHLPDRPEPIQIAKDRSLKQTKSKYKTGWAASNLKKVPLHGRINQFQVGPYRLCIILGIIWSIFGKTSGTPSSIICYFY